MKAWHFVERDENGNYVTSQGRIKVAEGETLRHKGELKLCKSGLHASVKALDALNYAHGAIVCRVEVSGEIIHGDDKLVAEKRTVIWTLDVDRLLHEFACDVAENVLRKEAITDERYWNAINVKRQWLDGNATDNDLRGARDVARDVAWGAARAAAWDAAWDVAWDVARAAAWGAAQDVAWGAAQDVAWGAARDVAWGAAWDVLNADLEQRLFALHGG